MVSIGRRITQGQDHMVRSVEIKQLEKNVWFQMYRCKVWLRYISLDHSIQNIRFICKKTQLIKASNSVNLFVNYISLISWLVGNSYLCVMSKVFLCFQCKYLSRDLVWFEQNRPLLILILLYACENWSQTLFFVMIRFLTCMPVSFILVVLILVFTPQTQFEIIITFFLLITGVLVLMDLIELSFVFLTESAKTVCTFLLLCMIRLISLPPIIACGNIIYFGPSSWVLLILILLRGGAISVWRLKCCILSS